MTEHTDYFKSPEHESLVRAAIERELKRSWEIAETSGTFALLSDAIGTLTFHTGLFRRIGLKTVAVNILKTALQQARKGTD